MTENYKINVLRGRKLSLEGATPIGAGAVGKVYLLPDDNVVKVLYGTDEKEAEREIQLSKWAFAKGIPTAISYDVVDVDGHPGLVYESLGRGNLRNELRDRPDDLPALFEKYLALIHKINAIEVNDRRVPACKQKVIDNLHSIQPYCTPAEYDRIIKLAETIPEDNHLIHGDCHIKNIKLVKGQFFLIDLDTLSTGDPIFELMGLCCCYDAYHNVDDNGYDRFFELDDSVIQQVYHYILDNYFAHIGEADKRENQTKIELLSYAYMLYQLDPNDSNRAGLFEENYAKMQARLYAVDDLVLKR